MKSAMQTEIHTCPLRMAHDNGTSQTSAIGQPENKHQDKHQNRHHANILLEDCGSSAKKLTRARAKIVLF